MLEGFFAQEVFAQTALKRQSVNAERNKDTKVFFIFILKFVFIKYFNFNVF